MNLHNPPDFHTTETLPAFADTRTLARWSGLSSERLKDLRRVGGGPAFVKVKKSVYYLRADVLAWIEAIRRSTTRDPMNGKTPERVASLTGSGAVLNGEIKETGNAVCKPRL